MNHRVYKHQGDLKLESGEVLNKPEIAYHTYGKYDPAKNNVVWVCHALTANSDVFEWWPGLFGRADFYNPNDYYIVCANILGSCYGSTGPLSENPGTGKPYYHDFPLLTVRDLVKAHELLREHLGIEKIHTVIGGSLGGHQALEWLVEKPSLIDHGIILASNARHSAWGIAFNESQRMAIESDHSWKEKRNDAGLEGMRTARSVALLSYRNYETYRITQTDKDPELLDHYRARSYQRYQGQKLARRFNAFSYYSLSRTMDTHHIGRNRKSLNHALNSIKASVLCISLDTDILFPTREQAFIAEQVSKGKHTILRSVYGHDGFLLETEQIAAAIDGFYKQKKSGSFLPGFLYVN